MICSNCGESMTENMLFCPKCGKAINKTNLKETNEKKTRYIPDTLFTIAIPIGLLIIGTIIHMYFPKYENIFGIVFYPSFFAGGILAINNCKEDKNFLSIISIIIFSIIILIQIGYSIIDLKNVFIQNKYYDNYAIIFITTKVITILLLCIAYCASIIKLIKKEKINKIIILLFLVALLSITITKITIFLNN